MRPMIVMWPTYADGHISNIHIYKERLRSEVRGLHHLRPGKFNVIIRRGFAARCAVVVTSGRIYSISLYDNCVLVGRSSAGHKRGWPVVTICPITTGRCLEKPPSARV